MSSHCIIRTHWYISLCIYKMYFLIYFSSSLWNMILTAINYACTNVTAFFFSKQPFVNYYLFPKRVAYIGIVFIFFIVKIIFSTRNIAIYIWLVGRPPPQKKDGYDPYFNSFCRILWKQITFFKVLPFWWKFPAIVLSQASVDMDRRNPKGDHSRTGSRRVAFPVKWKWLNTPHFYWHFGFL